MELLYNIAFLNRERIKIFNEALSVFNKVFPSISSKKRSRSEGLSNDRSSIMSSDRSVLGPSIGKVGGQSHAANNSGFEPEQQKSEERTKNVPNKRTRTSFVDMKVSVMILWMLFFWFSQSISPFFLIIAAGYKKYGYTFP